MQTRVTRYTDDVLGSDEWRVYKYMSGSIGNRLPCLLDDCLSIVSLSDKLYCLGLIVTIRSLILF